MFVLCVTRGAQRIINRRTVLSETALILHWISFCHCHAVSTVGDVLSIMFLLDLLFTDTI